MPSRKAVFGEISLIHKELVAVATVAVAGEPLVVLEAALEGETSLAVPTTPVVTIYAMKLKVRQFREYAATSVAKAVSRSIVAICKRSFCVGRFATVVINPFMESEVVFFTTLPRVE